MVKRKHIGWKEKEKINEGEGKGKKQRKNVYEKRFKKKQEKPM